MNISANASIWLCGTDSCCAMTTAATKKGKASKLLACAALARARQPDCTASQALGLPLSYPPSRRNLPMAPDLAMPAQTIGNNAATKTHQCARENWVVMVGVNPKKNSLSQTIRSAVLAPIDQSMGDCAQVHVLQFATGRHTARQTGQRQAPGLERLADHMRGRLAFGGEVGG